MQVVGNCLGRMSMQRSPWPKCGERLVARAAALSEGGTQHPGSLLMNLHSLACQVGARWIVMLRGGVQGFPGRCQYRLVVPQEPANHLGGVGQLSLVENPGQL